MDAVELVEWQALYTQIEPMPEDRAELRNGTMIANVLSHLTKGQFFRPADYMATFDGKPKKPGQTIEQMKAIWKQVVAGFNRPRKKKR